MPRHAPGILKTLTMKITQNNISIINRDCNIEGNLHFTGHLIIEGIITGTLHAESVFTEKNSRISAKIKAISITIAGRFDGEIEATDTLALLESARARGQFRCRKLIIDAGGILNGSVKFLSPEDTTPTLSGETIKM